MRTCATCIYWLKQGKCPTQRHIMYDNRAVIIPPGDEGQCRAMPPAQDNRWPLTMAGDWCGCWQGGTPLSPAGDPVLVRGSRRGETEARTLTEDNAPGATAAGETRELPESASAEATADKPDGQSVHAEGGKATPPVKPAAASAAGGPRSLLQRLTGKGHRPDAQK